MSEPRGGCPCRYTTPCSPNCTCANDASSAGCRRCARYGSPQQKKAMAEHIAATLDKGLAYDALAERVRKAEEDIALLRSACEEGLELAGGVLDSDIHIRGASATAELMRDAMRLTAPSITAPATEEAK